MKILNRKINASKIVLVFSSVYIGLSFVLYYAIDLKNLFGLRDWLLNTEGVYFYFTYTPFFFQHYGRDGGFAEVVQWLLLALAIAISLYYAGKTSANKKLSAFLLIFGLGMMLMLLEDAGELRHIFMSYIQWAAGEADQGLYGTAFEAIFFVILGGLPVYAFWRYGSSVLDYGKTYLYVLLGIISHAIAAGLSFVGTAFQMTVDVDVYSKMGELFREYSIRIGGEELRLIWDTWDAENWLYQTNFYLMDSFVEENIELLGNAFFLAALLSFAAICSKSNDKTQEKTTESNVKPN
ncbi:MAG TPA: hypothetical protein PKA42_00260 [Candidatus Paceibacterota bacterium]|nr:hypothetical protein [Candidatus Paceibacterota bacterium]HMO82578.1 hypothetical protein [Candidatus Paceibacterota bacterium]